MANINVNDLLNLNPSGSELFNDSESFMTELSEESEQVIGGLPVKCLAPTCQVTDGVCAGSRSIIIAFAE